MSSTSEVSPGEKKPRRRGLKPGPKKGSVKRTKIKRKGSGPTDLPKEVVQAMAQAMLEAGDGVPTVAKAIGIHKETVYRWIKEGSILEQPKALVEGAKNAMGGVLIAKWMEVANKLTDQRLEALNGYQLGVMLGILTDKIAKVFGEDIAPLVNIDLTSATPVDKQVSDQVFQFQQELARRRGLTANERPGHPAGTETIAGATGSDQDDAQADVLRASGETDPVLPG